MSVLWETMVKLATHVVLRAGEQRVISLTDPPRAAVRRKTRRVWPPQVPLEDGCIGRTSGILNFSPTPPATQHLPRPVFLPAEGQLSAREHSVQRWP